MMLLLAAALGKAASSSLLYPHEVLLTRMSSGAPQYVSVMGTLSIIVETEGVLGLYSGIGAHLLRSVPNTAITFVLFDVLQSSLPRLVEQCPWGAGNCCDEERVDGGPASAV
jgi:solute carrier family 25 protein 33/36